MKKILISLFFLVNFSSIYPQQKNFIRTNNNLIVAISTYHDSNVNLRSVSCNYVNQYMTTDPADPTVEVNFMLNGDGGIDYPDSWHDQFGNNYTNVSGISFTGNYAVEFRSAINAVNNVINNTGCGGAGNFNTQQFQGTATTFDNFYANYKKLWYKRKIQCSGVDPLTLNPHTHLDTNMNSYNCTAITGIAAQLAAANPSPQLSNFKGESHAITGPLTLNSTYNFSYWANYLCTAALTGFYFTDANSSYGHLYHMTQPGTGYNTSFVIDTVKNTAGQIYMFLYFSTNNQIPLPLSLLSFSATADKDNSVLLSWQTAEEVGRDNMTLYRSTDAKDWEEIYQITSSGNYSGNLYHYKDVDIHHDRYYYKLVVNDKEWIREVSLNENEAQIHIYPNPTDGLVVVKNPSDSPIFVFDAIGKLIQSFENQNDITKIQLDRGVYIFQIGNQKEKVVVR